MNYQNAQLELQKILRTQNTVAVSKLMEIVQAMEIPLYGRQFDAGEAEVLKEKIQRRSCSR